MNVRQLKSRKLTLEYAVERFLFDCRSSNLSGRTIETYEAHLKKFQSFMGNVSLHAITSDDISAFAASGEGLSPSYINNWLRSLSAFFNYHGLPFKIRKLKEESKIIVPFTEEQVKALLKQPDKTTFSGKRDYTIMVLLLDTGMRISEATGIKRADINWEGGFVLVRGKGKKERLVPLSETTMNLLQDYIYEIEDLPESKAIFISYLDNPLEASQFHKRLQIYKGKAGITGVRVSAHTFRHTFAKMFLLNGGDMFILQKILGHTSLEMVRKYVNMFSGDVQEQHSKYSPLDMLVKKRRR